MEILLYRPVFIDAINSQEHNCTTVLTTHTPHIMTEQVKLLFECLNRPAFKHTATMKSAADRRRVRHLLNLAMFAEVAGVTDIDKFLSEIKESDEYRIPPPDLILERGMRLLLWNEQIFEVISAASDDPEQLARAYKIGSPYSPLEFHSNGYVARISFFELKSKLNVRAAYLPAKS